jgi:hypothetical protein
MVEECCGTCVLDDDKPYKLHDFNDLHEMIEECYDCYVKTNGKSHKLHILMVNKK